MKIYQIHKYGGDWEDYRDYIVGSYLSEEKAITEKKRLEQEEEELEKCNNCPLYYCDEDCNKHCNWDCDNCKNTDINRVMEYCNEYKPYKDDPYRCMKFCPKFNDSYYKIEEVEVIE